MTAKTPRHRLPRIVPLAALGALLAAAACELSPRPTGPTPTEPTLVDLADGGETSADGPVRLRTARQDDTTYLVTPGGDSVRATRIRIRGANFGGGDSPIYFIDGKRVTVAEVESLDPGRIDEVHVLKGDQAVERFGPEAEHGAVTIITRKEGGPRASAAPPSAGVEVTPTLPMRRLEGAAAPPLILLDGARYEGRVEDLDPQRIEKVEIIKDPAAVQRYGPDAKDGVILITTKAATYRGYGQPETVILREGVVTRADPAASRQQEAEGRIAGIVTDAATGQPLAGVEVSLPSARRGAVTNPEGMFMLLASPGRHTVVLKRGDVEARREVKVSAGGTQTVRVGM